MEPIVEVKNLTKQFGNNEALKQINFEINEGQIFGFLGPSGSGKTTAINILTGQMSFNKGEARILGKSVKRLSSKDLSKIGIVSDQSGFYEKLSLYKNIKIYAKIHNINMGRVDKLLQDVGLYEDRNKKAEKLSTGMKQRMLLVRALIHKPKILFLDEPTSGLDPTTSRQIHRLLKQLQENKVTIFLTTHDMHEATKLCNQLVLLYSGTIIEEGTPAKITNNHNENKSVEITYSDNQQEILSLDNFEYKNNKQTISSIHTLEPTLEDVFIKLTGVGLNG